MKKIVLATTALVLSTGVAAAEVKVGGNAWAGITYNSQPGFGINKTQVNTRLRFNFDASKQLDSGVELGGRIRLQSDHDGEGRTASTLNMASIFAKTGGLEVQVGNVEAAFDNLGLLYNSELGYIGTTQGSYAFADYAGYVSRAYDTGQENRMGVFVAYTVGDLVARMSYITPNQVTKANQAEELSVSFDYVAGPFSFGVGYANNAGFNSGNDVYALTGEYAINGATSVGLHYVDNGKIGGVDQGRNVTLYGKTSVGNGIGLGGFVSNIDSKALNASGVTKKTAYGIGFDYDLGGATLAGTVQRTHSSTTYADLGINFSF
ncbi:MAG: porin [Gemmobacter sp.]